MEGSREEEAESSQGSSRVHCPRGQSTSVILAYTHGPYFSINHVPEGRSLRAVASPAAAELHLMRSRVSNFDNLSFTVAGSGF